MLLTQMPGLYIQEGELRGRGVYTSENVTKGDLIELCPVIELSLEDSQVIHNTKLHDYYFIWEMEKGTTAIGLGFASLYNHSEEANAEFETDLDARIIRIIAKKDIPAHEEICLNYLSGDRSDYKLWFKSR